MSAIVEKSLGIDYGRYDKYDAKSVQNCAEQGKNVHKGFLHKASASIA